MFSTFDIRKTREWNRNRTLFSGGNEGGKSRTRCNRGKEGAAYIGPGGSREGVVKDTSSGTNVSHPGPVRAPFALISRSGNQVMRKCSHTIPGIALSSPGSGNGPHYIAI